MAFALGADVVQVAREAMLSIGCIQAQKCHTNTCPAGVATQNHWLQRGLLVPEKSERASNYLTYFRKELLELTHAAGYEHPCEFNLSDLKMNTSDFYQAKDLSDIFGYQKTTVIFNGVNEIVTCPNLGAAPNLN